MKKGNFKAAFNTGVGLIVVLMSVFHAHSSNASIGSSIEQNREPASKKSARLKMKRVIRPSWSQSAVAIDASKTNESYFASTKYVGDGRSLNGKIFGPDLNSKDLEASEQAYEISKARGTENAQSEKGRFDRIRDYAKRAMDKISKFHLKTQFQHAKKYAENTDSAAREPLAAAVIATSLYTGRSFGFRIVDGVRFSGRTELKDKYASAGVQLPGVALSSQVQTERGSVNALISKQITDQISASVGTKDRGTAQVNYSVSF